MAIVDVPGMRTPSPPPRLFPSTPASTRATADALEDLLASHALLKEMDNLDLKTRLNMPLGERNRRVDATLEALDSFIATLS